jgi:hypothetical protein
MNTSTDHHEVVDTDAPLVTFIEICHSVRLFFEALGVITACVVVGLWFGGFFHWIAKSFPNGLLAQLIGV